MQKDNSKSLVSAGWIEKIRLSPSPFHFVPLDQTFRQVCFPLHSYLCLILHTVYLFIYLTFVKEKSDILVELSESSEADLNETQEESAVGLLLQLLKQVPYLCKGQSKHLA